MWCKCIRCAWCVAKGLRNSTEDQKASIISLVHTSGDDAFVTSPHVTLSRVGIFGKFPKSRGGISGIPEITFRDSVFFWSVDDVQLQYFKLRNDLRETVKLAQSWLHRRSTTIQKTVLYSIKAAHAHGCIVWQQAFVRAHWSTSEEGK